MNKFIISAFLFLGINCVRAQNNPKYTPSNILQSLKKLNTLGSVLYIAAHPDDENTRLLAYMANERNYRTGYLSLTRGDGGQNLIGKEQGEALGLLRTHELLAARRTDGAEQFFTRAYDFGFSKNPEETFQFWNHDSLLSDVVLCIRRFKPDVIICRFPTTGEGGHGHHTASAILAREAFDAAADSTRFKWQLKITQVWKAKSLYWNTFNFGEINTTSPNQLKLEAGGYNALLGKNYGEIAAESRSMHKCQGFGSLLERGSGIEYFKYFKGDSVAGDLFEKINTGWSRLNETASIQKMITNCIQAFQVTSPEKSIDLLSMIYSKILSLDEMNPETAYWKKLKLMETENLILACSGIWMEAMASDYSTVPGQDIQVTAQIINRSQANFVLNKISFSNLKDTSMAMELKNNVLYSFKQKLSLPSNMPYSNPYWLNQSISNSLYVVNDAGNIGKPQNNATLHVKFLIRFGKQNLLVERPVQYKYSDPAKGEIYRPLEILPPVILNFPQKAFVFGDLKSKTIQLSIKANRASVQGSIEIPAADGFSISISNPTFNLKNKNDEALVDVIVTPLKSNVEAKLLPVIKVNGQSYSKSLRRIEYDHIPYQFILSDAQAKIVSLDLKKAGTSIGYIAGAGDDIESSLKQIGYNVTRLTDDMLSKDDLSVYDAIITGVRAYNINERLLVHYPRLMNYVFNGGNLIVQYNTNNKIGPLEAKIGPYPFTVSRDRVTNENAEVRFINTKHPALNLPNVISADDFKNWIQERGTYFATDLDKNYETILSMNDPGEKSSEGSLINAKYGKGNFVYSGLAFFRQLPAGVPGAYRLFVNLLSLPKNK